MTDPSGPAGAGGLQFDRAEPTAPAAARPSCIGCQKPIEDFYFALNGKVVCSSCRQGVERELAAESAALRLLKAALFGLLAAVPGAVLYYAVFKWQGSEYAIISILIGYLVGRAVRKGSGNRGGWAFQGLAMAITYAAIVSCYMPFMFKDVAVTPQSLLLAFGIACTVPFRGGSNNFVGWIIIGVALFEAWQLNRKVALVFNGPFRVGEGPPPPSVPAPPPGGPPVA